MFNLKKKVVIITGGCGQIGEKFTGTLLEAGSTVIIADSNKLNKNSKLFKYKNNLLQIVTDVTDKESVLNMVETVLKKYKRIDILINNAGIGVFTSFRKRTIGEFMSVLKVNLLGTFLCAQTVVNKAMIKQRSGNIINVGSVYGIVGSDPRIYSKSGRNSSEVYGASKAGIIQMTKYLAVHLAKYNIRVNCISPGGVFNNQQKQFVNNYNLKTPLGRMARTEDLKGALIFCLAKTALIAGRKYFEAFETPPIKTIYSGFKTRIIPLSARPR